MEELTWKKWLKVFSSIIDSPEPRKVNMELYDCCTRFPHSIPSFNELSELCTSLVRLRHSKCYGRIDHECSLMQRLRFLVAGITHNELPELESQMDLFESDVEDESYSLSTEAAAAIDLIAEFGLEALTDSIKREKQKAVRQNAAFSLLSGVLLYTGESKYTDKSIEIAKAFVSAKDEKIGVGAAEYLVAHYIRQEAEIPKDIIDSINAFESSSKDIDTIRSLNVLLVDCRELDGFSAMMRMDDLKGESDWED